MVAITRLLREHIIESVQAMCTDVAAFPQKVFHFPIGRTACEFVEYPAAQLDAIPATTVESFAGVGYPFSITAIRAGDVVLYIGAGIGTDALIVALLTDQSGQIYALDMTLTMLDKFKNIARKAAVDHIEIIAADEETFPLPMASFDVVSSNGVLNLVPDKETAIAEIFRALKPGGHV